MPIWVVLVARFLEAMFIVGSMGSFVVLVLTGIEDVKTLIGSDEQEKTA
jgi:hypothetical protein